MRPTLFLMGPSDIEGQSITNLQPGEEGRVKVNASWSGILPIQPLVWGDPSLASKSTLVLVGIQQLRVPEKGRHNVFNLVGDADASRLTLRKIQAMEHEIGPVRYFNHPTAVFRTARASLPGTLADIPGCRVAQLQEADPASFEQLASVCEEFDRWPLILRARGYHAGENMVLVEDVTRLEAIGEEAWLYQGIFLIEFIDYKNPLGLYTKSRVIMVDGIPYPRHSITSDRCFIHSANRADLMGSRDDLCAAEKEYLSYLRDCSMNEYGDVFEQIYQRIGLDVFGIDFCVVEGEVVVFEANPCMDFLSQDYGTDDRYRYLETFVRAARRAIKRMLMTA